MTERWTAEFYEDANGRRPAEAWFEHLNDTKYAAMSAAITHLLERDGINLAGGSWLKPIGGGLHEFRVRHTSAEIIAMYAAADEPVPDGKVPAKILLRLFVHFHGRRVILLLHGYDKGDNPSPRQQQLEIKRATKALQAWKLAEARRASATRHHPNPT